MYVDCAELINNISQLLNNHYHNAILSNQYAWWIVESITKQMRTHLVTSKTILFTADDQKKLAGWLDQLINHHMPIQYLIGWVPFGDLTITIKPNTLIPRPETEEWCLKLVKQLHPFKDTKLTILDLCTGSGCIALTLAKALPSSTIYATDIDYCAVECAKYNACLNDIKNLVFIKSDLFTTFPINLSFDLIVANPPYIAPEEWNNLDKSVTYWEAKSALIANNNGMECIQAIIQNASSWLNRTGPLALTSTIPQLIIEIGYTQAEATIALMKAAHYNAIQVGKDLAGKDRTVSGRIDYDASYFSP